MKVDQPTWFCTLERSSSKCAACKASVHVLPATLGKAWQPVLNRRKRSMALRGKDNCSRSTGCCVATSLVACPGLSIARELIPLGGGIGGDTAAILLGLKLYNSFPFLHRYITLIAGSHHLISQAGWNRCNLSIYLSTGLCAGRPNHRTYTPQIHRRAPSDRHERALIATMFHARINCAERQLYKSLMSIFCMSKWLNSDGGDQRQALMCRL